MTPGMGTLLRRFAPRVLRRRCATIDGRKSRREVKRTDVRTKIPRKEKNKKLVHTIKTKHNDQVYSYLESQAGRYMDMYRLQPTEITIPLPSAAHSITIPDLDGRP